MMNTSPSFGRITALVGAIFQIGWVIGAFGTVIGVQHAFSTLSRSGIGDPEALSKSIGKALPSLCIGFSLSLIGLILICISLFILKYRSKWFFYFCVIYGLILLPGFPVGTALGLFFLVFCLSRKQEFLQNIPAAPNAAANL